MMAETRRSPLDGMALATGVRERPFLTQVDLRLDPADAALDDRIAAEIGAALPLMPNTVSHGRFGGVDIDVLWLGPDEWLIVAPDGQAAAIDAALRGAAGSADVVVIDVSANRTTLELAHADAREILAGGCPIDLDPRRFGPGDCAQTLVGRAGVILWPVALEPVPVYRLLVRPSFAAYLAAWLGDAIGTDSPP